MIRTLTPISSIIIAILLGIFFIQPEYEKSLVIQKETDEYKKAVEQYTGFSTLLDQKLDAKTSRPAYQNEQLDLLVPEDIDSVQLLVDIEEIAKNENLLFGNIAVSDEENTLTQGSDTGGQGVTEMVGFRDQLRTVDISFELIGTYEQFKEFLRSLEQSVTLFEIVEITFTPTKDMFQQFAVTVRVHALSK